MKLSTEPLVAGEDGLFLENINNDLFKDIDNKTLPKDSNHLVDAIGHNNCKINIKASED